MPSTWSILNSPLYRVSLLPLHVPSSVRVPLYIALLPLLSFICTHYPPPDSLLNERRTLANDIFAKWAWEWSLGLLIVLHVSRVTRTGVLTLAVKWAQLGGAWALKYACMALFAHVDRMTMQCRHGHPPLPHLVASMSDQLLHTLNTTQCHEVIGLHWGGFDISGHIYTQVMSNLIFVDEWRTTVREWNLPIAVQMPYTSLTEGLMMQIFSCISLLWDVHTLASVIYFHDVLTTLCALFPGLFNWWLFYRALPWTLQEAVRRHQHVLNTVTDQNKRQKKSGHLHLP